MVKSKWTNNILAQPVKTNEDDVLLVIPPVFDDSIIPNTKADIFMPTIREKVKANSIVYTDPFKSYNAVGVSELTHLSY